MRFRRNVNEAEEPIELNLIPLIDALKGFSARASTDGASKLAGTGVA